MYLEIYTNVFQKLIIQVLYFLDATNVMAMQITETNVWAEANA